MGKESRRIWKVKLTRGDGTVCRWTFVCTLNHARDLIKGYVQSCVYDCSWTMTDGEMMIEGKSEIHENGRDEKLSWSRKEMPMLKDNGKPSVTTRKALRDGWRCGKTHGSVWFLRQGSIPWTPSDIDTKMSDL